MGNIAGRTSIQDLVKSAMVSSANRIRMTDEADRQATHMGEKTAAAAPVQTKTASAVYVEKLASACDFCADILRKEANLGGPYSLSEKISPPPPGVSAATASKPLPDKKGEGVNTVPMHPGSQKGLPTEHGGTQMANTLDHTPGGKEHMVQKNAAKSGSVVSIIRAKLAGAKKTAADEKEKKETEGLDEAKKGVEKAEAAHKSEPENKEGAAPTSLVDYMLSRTKQAEDAINPAHISAGAAVEPDTSASGQPGGQPVGGAPQGPTGLIESNAAAENYTRGQAYANRKEDLKKYFDEPAMSAQHDNVLQVAFEHTSQAGPKIASADAKEAPSASVKTAAARALLMNLAKSAEQELSKTASATKQDKASVGLGA